MCTAELSPQVAPLASLQGRSPWEANIQGQRFQAVYALEAHIMCFLWGWFPIGTVSELQPISTQVSTCQADIGLKLRRDPSSAQPCSETGGSIPLQAL